MFGTFWGSEFELASELSQPDSSLEGVRVCICVGA